MSKTDAQLEKNIQVFLPPVLLKLASNQTAVKAKVMEILSHINKRVKPNENIKLPFDALLTQFTDHRITAFVKNFTLIYLEMSAGRQSPGEIANRLPELVQGISLRPVKQRIQLLHIILPVLEKWNMDHTEQLSAREEKFGFTKNPNDALTILGFFLDVMLYQPLTARDMNENSESIKHLGLSKQAVEDVTNNGKAEWTIKKLKEAKLGILKFVLTPIFTDSERLPLLTAGACDSNHQVVSACEDGLRRWTGSVDYEDKKTIQTLYRMYLGSKSSHEKDVRSAASASIRIRILQSLSKSVIAANMPGYMVQTIFEGIYGDSTTAKLQRSAMGYLQWCARISTEENMSQIAPIVVSGLLKYINQNEGGKGIDGDSVKGSAYVACGLVLKKAPKVGLSDLEVLSLFFERLETEEKNTRTYVQDALSSMIEVYVDLPSTSPVYKDLQDLILKTVQKNDPYSRYMALKYANAIYPFSSVFARYVCLLGFSNTVSKLEVKEECNRGLTPFVRSNISGLAKVVDVVPTSELPDLLELVTYIYQQKPHQEYTLSSKTPTVRGYPTEVYSEILGFIRMIWVLQANPTTILIDSYVSDKVDNSMSDDPVAMNNFRTNIEDFWSNGDIERREMVEQWLGLVQDGLNPDLRDPVLLTSSAKCLLEMISLGPSSISTIFNTNLDFFKSLCLSEKPDARALVSHIFGIIVSHESISEADIEQLLKEFNTLLEAPETQKQRDHPHRHGAVLAIGYVLGRCQYRHRSISHALVQRSIENLAKLLQGTPSSTFYSLAGAACQSLGEIGRTKVFPFPVKKKDEANDSMEITLTLQGIVEKLIDLSKSCKEVKVQEKAILALGHLSIPFKQHHSLVDLVLDCFFATADSKQVEIAFATGEAMSIVAFGWHSQAMQKFKDTSDMPVLETLEPLDYDFQSTLDKVVSRYVASDRSWYRKAASIWLLSILKFGQDHPLVSKNLRVIHASFSRLLGDRDDFTQECASKGLGLVYEYGDSGLKEDMLYSLVGTFTEGRTIQAQSVTDSTVLFEEGALGATPDGNSITTYKELCSLASELNQPDLIYKFMNLANHNAMWTSRKGAAFGFQNLMSLAEKEMTPYLPRLVPKLYRYQFDPNPRVNQTMKSIWQSLVKDNQKTIDTYFEQIMQDLLTGLGNHQWRVREASCAALNDLVQGRKLGQIEPFLEKLWQMSFRALDDIKDSVRQAATQTCRTLTKLTVHYCDPTMVAMNDGEKVMRIVMPFLLEKGIVSDAEDVRKFSLDAVLCVCKTGAGLLKKYIPEIIDTLLQSLSSLEPQSMNYLSFHVDKYNISQEQLDNARLNGAKNSPMMEGIEHCVYQIDDTVMEELTTRIIHIIRKGTGLPTKAGCARFIVTLVMNRRTTFAPYADDYLKALSGTVRSKNTVIRKSYATAIGYVCGVASRDRLLSLIKHLKKLYVEEEDEEAKAGSAVTAVEISRFAKDQANAVASSLVPLIYFGKNDPEKEIKELWKAAWEHLTSGVNSMVTLYVSEILAFVQPLLTSPSWGVKQTAALTIADMCTVSDASICPYADKLMPVIIATLATRVWAGKEHVVAALVRLFRATRQKASADMNVSPSGREVLELLVRELKRKNLRYQHQVMLSLQTFNEDFSERVEAFERPFVVLKALCLLDTKEVQEEDEDISSSLVDTIKSSAFRCLVSGFRPKTFSQQEAYTEELCKLLTDGYLGNPVNVQVAVVHSLDGFVKQCSQACLAKPGVYENLSETLTHASSYGRYSTVQSVAANTLVYLKQLSDESRNGSTHVV
ncbi:proteasome stabiliser-domain-containing protein [Sporodiniella umbellata]|nr:proteasome stabiliser-domain-containing protein [Sporodiniella umbellata]